MEADRERVVPRRQALRTGLVCVAASMGGGTVYLLTRSKSREPERKRSAQIEKRIELIAHRGWPARHPENSLQGFEAAMQAGADEVECDVWLSRDGVPVICHDELLDRTTNLCGRVSDQPYSALAKAGLRAPDGTTAGSAGLPRLEEVLECCAGRVGLNIEVKDFGHAEVIADHVRQFLSRRGHPGDTPAVYLALRPVLLADAARYASDLSRCALSGPVNAQEQIRLAREHGCRRIQFRRDNCSLQDVAEAKRAGLIVNYFWSDDPAELERLASWGVDAVLTNDVGRMSGRVVAR